MGSHLYGCVSCSATTASFVATENGATGSDSVSINGASTTPEVAAALAWAENFFNTYTPSSSFSKSLKTQATNSATLLNNYNNGLTGPGHCSE